MSMDSEHLVVLYAHVDFAMDTFVKKIVYIYVITREGILHNTMLCM